MTLTKRPSLLQDKEKSFTDLIDKEEAIAKEKNSRELDELQVSLLDDKTFLKGIIETFCQRPLEEEITHHPQAEAYQRTDKRRGYGNGYKPRGLRTRVEKLELLVPQDREGEFQTELFRRYQRSEKALVVSLMEMYLNMKELYEGENQILKVEPVDLDIGALATRA